MNGFKNILNGFKNINTMLFITNMSVRFIDNKSFNEIFDAQCVILPKNLYAVGLKNNDLFIYSEGQMIQWYFNPWINFFMKYIRQGIKKEKFYFVMCVYDGYRERIKYNLTNVFTTVNVQMNDYKDQVEIKCKSTEIPILHKMKYIFASCVHKNDYYSKCIVNFHYITYNFMFNFFDEISKNRVEWDRKLNVCVYRSTLPSDQKTNLFKENDEGPRHIFHRMYNNTRNILVNYSEEKMSISQQLQYKYILDIDGNTSTWTATIWKLYSGSVLLKQDSIWNQWFSDKLIEWVHYVPINNDMSNVFTQIQWCINNDDKCRQIVNNAKKFVEDNITLPRVIDDMKNLFNEYI